MRLGDQSHKVRVGALESESRRWWRDRKRVRVGGMRGGGVGQQVGERQRKRI